MLLGRRLHPVCVGAVTYTVYRRFNSLNTPPIDVGSGACCRARRRWTATGARRRAECCLGRVAGVAGRGCIVDATGVRRRDCCGYCTGELRVTTGSKKKKGVPVVT
eukprot:scaffold40016_cov100-Phaeocystis_antarctica.AAC.1